MSKLVVLWTNQFKKDYKSAIKRNLDIDLLDEVIKNLAINLIIFEHHYCKNIDLIINKNYLVTEIQILY